MTDYGHPITFGLRLWPMTAPLAQLEAFATEVVPAVRQRVSERRDLP